MDDLWMLQGTALHMSGLTYLAGLTFVPPD